VPSLREQLADQARRWPTPTNAQALAALDAYSGLPDGELDDDDEPTTHRLRRIALGYMAAGDKFAAAGNAAHYRAPYPFPGMLWAHLARNAATADLWVAQVDGVTPVIVVDAQLARGVKAELAREVTQDWDQLRADRAAGTDTVEESERLLQPLADQVNAAGLIDEWRRWREHWERIKRGARPILKPIEDVIRDPLAGPRRTAIVAVVIIIIIAVAAAKTYKHL